MDVNKKIKLLSEFSTVSDPYDFVIRCLLALEHEVDWQLYQNMREFCEEYVRVI